MNDMNDSTEILFLTNPSQHLKHPFHNKQIVFTGALSTMTRADAAKKVRACGGIMQGAVTKETDFLILGKKRRGISTKHKKAEQFISSGIDIQILNEDDFFWLISIH